MNKEDVYNIKDIHNVSMTGVQPKLFVRIFQKFVYWLTKKAEINWMLEANYEEFKIQQAFLKEQWDFLSKAKIEMSEENGAFQVTIPSHYPKKFKERAIRELKEQALEQLVYSGNRGYMKGYVTYSRLFEVDNGADVLFRREPKAEIILAEEHLKWKSNLESLLLGLGYSDPSSITENKNSEQRTDNFYEELGKKHFNLDLDL